MKKIAIILADGVEETEFIAVGDVLRRLSMEVCVAGLNGIDVRGAHGFGLKADRLLAECPPAEFDAVFLPGGMGGVEAVGRLKAVDPLLKAVVSSGYSTAPAMAHYREYGFDAVVAKPYTVNELRSVLDRLLSGDEEEG